MKHPDSDHNLAPETSPSSPEKKKKKLWSKTSVKGLQIYESTGQYYAYFKAHGKPIKRCLETDDRDAAERRLIDLKRLFCGLERNTAIKGKYTFAHALEEYRHTVQTAVDLKDSSKFYREQTIAALLKTWPGLIETPITKITEKACKDWAYKVSKEYSATRYNNTLGTLRAVIQVAVDHGYCSRNPAMSAKRAPIKDGVLNLPSREEFRQFIKEMRNSVGRLAKPAADLAEFLAFSGCRKEEAARATWKHVNFEKIELTIVGDPETGTKNWTYRTIPMVPNLVDFLKRLKEKRGGEPDPDDPICLVREAQKTMDRAAKAVNISRLTHHNLRDLFATQCIESGVDVPTVSKWLGHSDGGALCMKKYVNPRIGPGHDSAAKVQF